MLTKRVSPGTLTGVSKMETLLSANSAHCRPTRRAATILLLPDLVSFHLGFTVTFAVGI